MKRHLKILGILAVVVLSAAPFSRALIAPDQVNPYPGPVLPAETGIPVLNLNAFPLAVLDAPALEPNAVQTAFLEWLRQNPPELKGLTPENLVPVYTHFVRGEQGILDTFYVYLVQRNNDLPVSGTGLRAKIDVIRGKPQVVNVQAKIFPALDVSVPAPQPASDRDILESAIRKLQTMDPRTGSPQVLSRKRQIRYIGGRWRAVEEFSFQESPYRVAVDLNDIPETFGWDSRVYLQNTGAPDKAVSGRVTGTGLVLGQDKKDKIQALILTDLLAKVGGQDIPTDQDGRFSSPAQSPVPVEIALDGKWIASVKPRKGAPVKFSGTLEPGVPAEIQMNPGGGGESPIAQVNGMAHQTKTIQFLIQHGVPEQPFLSKPLNSVVMEPDHGNAYYEPWSHTTHFFSAGGGFSDTAREDVESHEDGHAYNNLFGGIQDDGLSEGIGDNVATFRQGFPELGLGFFADDPSKFIRSAKNDYQYNEHDEAHVKGAAYSGPAWDAREYLIQRLGPATGIAKAIALVIPAPVSAPDSIPTAIQQILLRDRDENGNYPDFNEIQKGAANHGIRISRPGLLSRLLASLLPLSGPVEEFTISVLSQIRRNQPLSVLSAMDPKEIPSSPAVHPELIERLAQNGLARENVISDIRELYPNVAQATLRAKKFKQAINSKTDRKVFESEGSRGFDQHVVLNEDGTVDLFTWGDPYLQHIKLGKKGAVLQTGFYPFSSSWFRQK